jgi:hypothetical protein
MSVRGGTDEPTLTAQEQQRTVEEDQAEDTQSRWA